MLKLELVWLGPKGPAYDIEQKTYISTSRLLADQVHLTMKL